MVRPVRLVCLDFPAFVRNAIRQFRKPSEFDEIRAQRLLGNQRQTLMCDAGDANPIAAFPGEHIIRDVAVDVDELKFDYDRAAPAGSHK